MLFFPHCHVYFRCTAYKLPQYTSPSPVLLNNMPALHQGGSGKVRKWLALPASLSCRKCCQVSEFYLWVPFFPAAAEHGLKHYSMSYLVLKHFLLKSHRVLKTEMLYISAVLIQRYSVFGWNWAQSQYLCSIWSHQLSDRELNLNIYINGEVEGCEVFIYQLNQHLNRSF